MYELAFALTSVVSVPRLNPLAPKAVNVFALVVSAAVVSDERYLPVPRTESNSAWLVALGVRDLIHTRSGWNDTLFTAFDSDRAAALPV